LLSFAAGCKDDAPPPAPAPEPSAATSVLIRAPKINPAGMMAVSPAVRRSLLQPVADADGGEASEAGAPAPSPTRTWSFDKEKADEPPPGFELAASAGKPGNWLVKADPGAPSAPNVLAQLDGDKTEARFLTAMLMERTLRDGRVSVRCRPVSGKVDQACGLAFRFRDPKNYYVARASGLEKNVNLYVVKDGKRTQIGGWSGATFGNAWHELRVDAKGEHLEVGWDGSVVYQADDKTFVEAGRVGVWTKADSVTYFDDLTITPL
jgi:hypothetical protein